jgi:hypothetical protein
MLSRPHHNNSRVESRAHLQMRKDTDLALVTFCEISYLQAILYLLTLSVVSMVREYNCRRLSLRTSNPTYIPVPPSLEPPYRHIDVSMN